MYPSVYVGRMPGAAVDVVGATAGAKVVVVVVVVVVVMHERVSGDAGHSCAFPFTEM